jgi:hypothetical protein
MSMPFLHLLYMYVILFIYFLLDSWFRMVSGVKYLILGRMFMFILKVDLKKKYQKYECKFEILLKAGQGQIATNVLE